MDKCNKVDDAFCLAWAKKIMAADLLGGKCKKCGNSNIMSLTFHHHNKDKENGINDLKNNRWSMIRREVMKCELLCRNCHLEIHSSGTGRNDMLKRKLLDIKGIYKCEDCGYSPSKLGILCFHHLREKKFDINVCRIRFPDISWEDVLLEMDKCIVLCQNCHNIRHIAVDKFNRLRSLIDFKIKNYKELRPPIDINVVRDMYCNKKMRQVDIVRHFGCSKGTISGIVKKLNLTP